jgi:hypothetical protein
MYDARKAGVQWGSLLVDVFQKVALFAGPLGMLVSVMVSLFKHMKDGKGIIHALKETLIDFANNLTFGLFGKVMNKLDPKGGWSNIERMKARQVNDMIITDAGEVIEPSSQDTIMAGKPGGPIAKAFQGIGGFAAGGPMGMILQGALRQTMGPLLKEAITDPVVAALTGTQGGDQKQPINIVVKIGEKELNDQIITALNSPQGSRAISPFYQG